jgi:hypothetical protein
MSRLRTRFVTSAALLGIAGCGGQLGDGDRADAFVAEDVFTEPPDAPFAFDAPGLDAPFAIDAGTDVGMDAPFAIDMGISLPDARSIGTDAFWGTCATGGRMGTCMPMSLCTMGSMPVMGLCPGPADIQCCLPGRDAGPPVDAFRMGGSVTPAEIIARLGACNRIGGDYAKDSGGTANIPVCETDNVIWWNADFDVDCDGGRGAVCMSDPDYLPDTSATDSMGNPLDASTLPFIVIPLASTRFRYVDHGIRAGQVALVLYRDRMVFGIFGDAGPASIIGEGSFAMAEALGIPSNPRTGGVDSGVTYLVFTGTTARVAHNESHAEAVTLGSSLLSAFVP